MPSHNTDSDKLTSAMKAEKAFNLRLAGMPYSQIGQHLGISAQRAHQIIKRHLDQSLERIRDMADRARTIELSRLDNLWVSMYQKAIQGDYAAVDRCLKIMEQRAKLTGINAPIEVKTTTTYEIVKPTEMPDELPPQTDEEFFKLTSQPAESAPEALPDGATRHD